MSRPLQPLGGYLAIAGGLSMIAGAIFWGASGTSLWETLADNHMESYLIEAAHAQTLLVINTGFWIVGVLLLGTAGTIMSGIAILKAGAARIALVCIRTAVPVAIVSFITMLSLTVKIAPDTSPASLVVAGVVGWIGVRLDDLATILIIGAGPFFISISGYGEWVPRWLHIWGFAAGLSGLLAVAAILFPSVSDLSFIIIPVGLGWMIAAGIILVKQK
jgi:hypothetical protein